jgi:hypothetical protein
MKYSLPFTLLVVFFYTGNSELIFPETIQKKKLLISNIHFSKEISDQAKRSFFSKLKAYIIESSSDTYSVLSQLDLEMLMKNAEIMQREGNDYKDILHRVSQSRDADEIIYGRVIRENGLIGLSLSNIQRNENSEDYSIKSIVEISFLEGDLNFYLKESANKILNPKYKMKAGEVFFEQKENSKEEIFDKPIALQSRKWGDFEGVMNWEEAVATCEAKGMRLPAPFELRIIALVKEESLREPCCVFWSSRSRGGEFAYYIDINDGFGNYYHKEIALRVRCIKTILTKRN